MQTQSTQKKPMKKSVRAFFALVIIGVLVIIGSKTGIIGNLLPGAKTKSSVVPIAVNIPTDVGTNPNDGYAEPVNVSMPSSTPAVNDGSGAKMLVWAWNAQMGLMFANGGPMTTADSLMAKHNVSLILERQDDSNKMQEALLTFATDVSRGVQNPSRGAAFVCIMGDGGAQFLAGLNHQLARLGPQYRARIVGSCGYSRGEDKFMGPPAWKQNPQAAMGGLVAGVLRDGDWNIAQKWLSDNGLKNNPDEKTWDPNALNWVAANDYIDAGTKYISGYAEDRPEVVNGKRTGRTVHVTVSGAVTWTPGDVNIAHQRGGLVSIASTREYTRQMPNVIIGIDAWMKTHKQFVEGMLQAIADGGAAVKYDSNALNKAGEISQEVYQEQGADAGYWVRYYKGSTETDRAGLSIPLGGSSVNDMADELYTFGLTPGSANLVAATYSAFGDVDVQQYPNLIPSYPPADQAIDTEYLRDLAVNYHPSQQRLATVNSDVPRVKGTVAISKKNWSIPFNSGSDQFSPDAQAVLKKLSRDLLIASGASVELYGHTDSQGNSQANKDLSERRAFHVQQWLQNNFPANFPQGRVTVFAMGDTQPIAPNSTAEGRAKNRRVTVVLSTGG